jgi:hypothetical protein
MITIKNTKKIESDLAACQKGCRERTFTLVDIEIAVETLEKRLKSIGIPQSQWGGTTATVGGWGRPAKSYRYPFAGTVATIIIAANGKSASVAVARTTGSTTEWLNLGEAAKAWIAQDYHLRLR